MIALLPFWVTIAAGVPASADAAVLLPPAVCRLVRQDATPLGKVYVVRGSYIWTFENRPFLTPDGCDPSFGFEAQMEGEAQAKMSRFDDAMLAKCGSRLIGGEISGRFTGRYIRDAKPHAETFLGRTFMVRSSRFIITDVDSPQLDSSTITCSK